MVQIDNWSLTAARVRQVGSVKLLIEQFLDGITYKYNGIKTVLEQKCCGVGTVAL
jgi:hypothetical protein